MGRALLLLVSGMFIVVGIVQSGINNRNSVVPERTNNYHAELHAKNTLNSAMDFALREIINNQNWTGGFKSDNFMGTPVSVDVSVYDQSSSDIPPNNIPVWDQFSLLIHGTATYRGQEAQSEIYLRKDSFSKYSYFTDYEPSNIYFIWSDELSGPVHTNGRLNIAGDPTFYGKVTSPQMWNGYFAMSNNPNFYGGSDFNAKRRDPPTDHTLDVLRNSASANGLKFDKNVRLDFLDNGNLFVQEPPPRWWMRPVQYTVDMSKYNGVISSSEEIYMSGTISGQYTVHSEKDIIIEGDIRYKNDPTEDGNSDDILGIVSEEEVIIDDNAHRHEGSSDLTIHASIMALDKSFRAENYNTGYGRGDLELLGGVIQQQRGPMGTFRSGAILSGFNKKYAYDERLLEMNPPSFPRESFFSVMHWHTSVTPGDYNSNGSGSGEDNGNESDDG